MLEASPTLEQKTNWVKEGCVILANYDAESVIVYQAYRLSISHFAAKHSYFERILLRQELKRRSLFWFI